MTDFDAQVAELRGKVPAKQARKKKADCTPEEWAGTLDYYAQRSPDSRLAASRKWKLANPDKVREGKQRWQSANPERHQSAASKRRKRWESNNPDACKASKNKWDRSNRKGIAASRRERYQADPNYRMAVCLRSRLKMAIRCKSKQGSAVHDLGCTIAEFWAHMESQFQPGMTRENMGKAWEIDHIYPLSKADLTGSRMEFLAANNWRNLQPLTPKQNLEKGDTITTEAQALFDQLCAEFAEKVAA